jgi:tocopherol cyclase
VDTVKAARWEYSTQPTYGWGNVGSKQKSTAGWLAALPVFESHWQICMASGLSTGFSFFHRLTIDIPQLIMIFL